MPSIFRTWTYKFAQDAHVAMVAATVGREGFQENLLFAEQGDHWQNGAAWPLSGNLNPMVRTVVLAAVQPQFRPVDVIGEVLDNVANGLLEREADVSFVPRAPVTDAASAEAQTQAVEIAAMVSRIAAWWDAKQFWEAVRLAVRRSRWAPSAALRLWITRDTLITNTDSTGKDATSLPTDLPFEDALAAVQLMAPTPATGFVYVDPDTQSRCGVFFYAVRAPGASLEQPPTINRAELWFVDGDQTILRIVEENNDVGSEFPVTIGRRMPIAQMSADLLITDSIRRQQRSLNFFETLLVRVIETAGFPERYTTNAMPQGVWLRVPPTNEPPLEIRVIADETWYLHAVPRVLGPMFTADLRGITTEDDQGKKVTATPGISFKDPTDPEYLTKASNHGRFTMLRECKQGHLANESTAEASGLAYIQARAGFGKDLKATKAPLEGMVRDILEAAIALAEQMSGVTAAASFLAKYRCVVTLHVDTGPPSPAEMTEWCAQAKDGFIARATAMTNLGVEDTAAEMAAIATDPMYLAALRTAQGLAMDAQQKGGASFFGAARSIGLSDEEAKALMATDTNNIDVKP